MKRLDDGQHYQLSTGRKFYAHNGIIGIGEPDDPSFDSGQLFEGYDGYIETVERDYDDAGKRIEVSRWTREERRELAQFMAAHWLAWAERDDR